MTLKCASQIREFSIKICLKTMRFPLKIAPFLREIVLCCTNFNYKSFKLWSTFEGHYCTFLLNRHHLFWTFEDHPEDCIDELLGDKLQEVMKKMQRKVAKGRLANYFVKGANHLGSIQRGKLRRAEDQFFKVGTNYVFLAIPLLGLETSWYATKLVTSGTISYQTSAISYTKLVLLVLNDFIGGWSNLF